MSRKESEVTLEGTLGIIKPAAVVKEDQILDAIRQAGFLIVEKRRFRFSQSLAQEFYRGNKDNVAEVTSGDCVALCLARENGVNEWKELMGRPSDPNSLRSRFGWTAFHGSQTPADSEREIELIFPHILNGQDDSDPDDEGTKGVMTNVLDKSLAEQPDDDHKRYLQKHICPTLVKGLTEMYEVRPKSPLGWLADWLSENNPYRQ